ncbi:UDP-N-acetyl glucosamine 2-epimerase [Methanogenium sp. S4BF]|uniref:UDP-N-acetylglucosamine 2-epimerase n=1 Tax=Methanogenium sp. S4BF TaxID=1789226 RepID=UPI0024165483|nr:UDP-N-acetylglucosamine 2-epimerase [Methanogenium sp. S4BF]WFN35318.1 UDP-N-acetyl glucosamine 2-epimerase [Methanogenium sp. S4BF]
MKTVVIRIATHPEIISMPTTMQECEQEMNNDLIPHTGRHLSHERDRTFPEGSGLPEPPYNPDDSSGTPAEQIGRGRAGVETILMREHPDAVRVQGNTNNAPAGVHAASICHKYTVPMEPEGESDNLVHA